jgi:UDP-4-amino-4-deoxy-L-arabinose-oxoglutarate aminotransferase
MDMKVPFYRHDLDKSYADRVGEVLASPFLTTGGVARAVEAQLCTFFDVPHALLVNSWTNGAVAVLLALGVGPGHEVIVPAMTFIASANVVELVGAKPVFVDVEPDMLMPTPEAIRAAVTPNTRAVIPVHLYGQMCDIAALRAALADRPDIAIIEDCAHSFEASLDGDRPGAHSEAAIFSFYATKNVTCGEGGAIITRDPRLFETVQQTRLHGMSAGAIDRFAKNAYRHWDMMRLGTKANLPDLLASLLPPQIASIRERLPLREERAALREGLRGECDPARQDRARRGPCPAPLPDPRPGLGARRGARRPQPARHRNHSQFPLRPHAHLLPREVRLRRR